MDLNLNSQSNHFTIMHINCRSIMNKIPDIKIVLSQLSNDVLAVTETWLDDLSADTIRMPCYRFVHKCRENDRGGSVGCFVKHTIALDHC